LGPAVSGFANSGGGRFVAGVCDETGDADGGFQIENFAGTQSFRAWADNIIHNVRPTPRYKIEVIEDSHGRGAITPGCAVFVVSVEESEHGPHMAPDGRYYIRAGVHTARATQFIVEAIWAKRHFLKPRIAHIVRERPDDVEAIQIGLLALTDSPAVNVQLTMEPLPGLLRNTGAREFPVSIGAIDPRFPFVFDITTRADAEGHQDEEFTLTATYDDLASNHYTYEHRINLFRSLPSLRFRRRGLTEIAEILEDLRRSVSQLGRRNPRSSGRGTPGNSAPTPP
jgi:hypothetical protein